MKRLIKNLTIVCVLLAGTTVTSSTGVAVLTTSSLDVAAHHKIGAIYSGDAIFTITGSDILHTVNKANTSVNISNLTLEGNPKYTISSGLTGEWTVNKRPITITAVNITINPGETPVLAYEITSGALVNGDVLTGELYCDSPYTIGENAITQGILSAGDNYAVTFVPGTLIVRSDDASVSRLEVDGLIAERSGNNFNIFSPCGANSVEIRVTANQYATAGGKVCFPFYKKYICINQPFI